MIVQVVQVDEIAFMGLLMKIEMLIFFLIIVEFFLLLLKINSFLRQLNFNNYDFFLNTWVVFFYKYNFYYLSNFKLFNKNNFFFLKKTFNIFNFKFHILLFNIHLKNLLSSVNIFYHCIFNNFFFYFFSFNFYNDIKIFYFYSYNLLILNKFGNFFKINYNFFKIFSYTFKFKKLMEFFKVKLIFLIDYYKSYFFFYFIKKLNLLTIAFITDEIFFKFFTHNIFVWKNNLLFKMVYLFILHDIYFLCLFKKQLKYISLYLSRFKQLV
jgi:hypothetical protein